MSLQDGASTSVVVRAYNEAEHLGRLIEGLQQQTVRVNEIVLVDSGSTDDTVAIAESHGCRIVHIDKAEFSFGRSLNRGFQASRGDIVLVMSAHVYPVFDTYVEHMIAAIEREGTAIVYGRQVGDHRTKFSESRIMLKWFPEESIWDQGHPFSNNASAAVRRKVWESIGYDETLTGLEDLDFARKAIALGNKIAYVADAPVVHVHEEAWSTVRNRYRREALAYSRIYPGTTLSTADAAGLAVRNIWSDYVHAAREREIRANLLGIPMFRLAQFRGAWQGFRDRERVSDALLERYYYPPESAGRLSNSDPGRQIMYGAEKER